MLQIPFMRDAFIAGTVIGISCGITSVFVVLRRALFFVHSIGHISITGAAIAAIYRFDSLMGQLGINVLISYLFALFEGKIKDNDLAIGMLLNFFLGLGVYIISKLQYGNLETLLFQGSVLSVYFIEGLMLKLVVLSVVNVIVLAIIAKPLLFYVLNPVVATVQNKHVSAIQMIFYINLAVNITVCSQVVGSLLIFTLIVGPAAVALQWCGSFKNIFLVSVIVAVLAIWTSLTISFYWTLPVGFCLSALISLLYLIGYLKNFILTAKN